LIDVIGQSGADDDERQENDENHGQGHQGSGQGAPVAEQPEQTPISGPARDAKHHRPEQRGHERPQDKQATDQQDQQDNPADIPFQPGAKFVHN